MDVLRIHSIIFFKPFSKFCFCLMFWFFDHEACGILVSQPETEAVPP